jgi:hypothetical protein
MAIAERRGLSICTLDQGMANAAAALGLSTEAL